MGNLKAGNRSHTLLALVSLAAIGAHLPACVLTQDQGPSGVEVSFVGGGYDDGDEDPCPDCEEVSMTRTDVTSSYTATFFMGVTFYICACYEESMDCSDESCGFCDASSITQSHCDGYSQPYIPSSFTACDAYYSASSACSTGCE